MRVGPVSARYANALFELALEKGALERVQADVALIANEVASDAKLFDARTSHATIDKRVEALAPRLHPLTANFVRLLRDKRRIDVLRELPAAFKRCTLTHENAVEGVVESAHAIGSGEVAELAVSLGSVLGKRVALEARVEPDLIAGVRVMVDNRLIDQSAEGRLEALRTKLLRARLSST